MIKVQYIPSDNVRAFFKTDFAQVVKPFRVSYTSADDSVKICGNNNCVTVRPFQWLTIHNDGTLEAE